MALPADMLELCEFLLNDEDEGAEWHAISEARLRCAVGRAYYAVFVQLKMMLIPVRPEWKGGRGFPADGVHRNLRAALEESLAGTALADDYAFLMTRRGKADYEPPPLTDLDKMAEQCLERAQSVIGDHLPNLTANQVKTLGNDLFDLSKGIRANRRRA